MANHQRTNQTNGQSIDGVENLFQTDTISVTLKFGFQQKSFKYIMDDGSSSIIERIHLDAENWLRLLVSSLKNIPVADCYTFHLFRIPTIDLTMVPITQVSDIEQNCLIELVVIPVEINQNPHTLYRYRLNSSTNCSLCSRLITANYLQAFRCRKCRRTYHKDCTPFILDDCTSPIEQKQKTGVESLQPMFVSPIVSAPSTVLDLAKNPTVPIYTTSVSNARENEMASIINEGIFPACLRGSQVFRRYLFLLTSTTLTLTLNLSAAIYYQEQVTPSSDSQTVFQLSDIIDLILTHFIEDRDHIFEIHFQDKLVLHIGKKSDPDDIQMQTAQFYSTIRDQWEALLNPSANSIVTLTVKGGTSLTRRKSVYRRPPCGSDNEDKDLHELYKFTGERIGEGN